MRGCVLLTVLLAFCGRAPADHVGVVRFNGRGITGSIMFIETSPTSTQIIANLQGLPGNSHHWHVHTLPIDQTRDPAIQCQSTWAGPHYDPFNVRGSLTDEEYNRQCSPATPAGCEAGDLAGKFGPLTMNGQVNVTDTTGQLVLDGRYSIIGRSVVVHVPGLECGTIRSEKEDMYGATVLQATFVNPVAGTIYFRQSRDEAVRMWGKLYWVNDAPTTSNHNWHIHMTAPGEEYRVGNCSSVGPHYDPTANGPTSAAGYDTRCTPDTPSMCEIGDLTGKHGTVSISATPTTFASNSFFFTDTFLNLTGVWPVEGRSVVIHQANRGGPMIACAPLVASETIVLSDHLTSYLTASQQSPFDDTVFTTSGSPPAGARLSILNSANAPNEICPADSSSVFDSTYNPYTVGSSQTTPDGYPLGDLQNRYTTSLSTASNTFRVFDMPVYGSNVTISGRVLRADFGSSRQCSAFIVDQSGNLLRGGAVTARATFNGTVVGNMFFLQQINSNGALSNTSTRVVVDIYYALERSQTTGHNWHVHMNPPQSGMRCVDVIGGHFNPFSVSLENMDSAEQPSTNSNYRDDCSPLFPLRCESGDLSGKHGQLSIASAGAGRPTYSYVDNNLHLMGNFSIVGRSIGLHLPSSEGGALFDCAAIREFYASPSSFSVQFTAGAYDRIGMARRLTDTTGVDPSDVLVLAESVEPMTVGGVTFQCANVTVRTMGDTQMEVATNYALLSARASAVFQCSGSPLTAASLSLLLMATCLLTALIY